MYRSDREKHGKSTYLAVCHGNLQNVLACMFTNNLGNADLEFFIPENNSLTILDFADVKEGVKEFVDCKLTAYNLKVVIPSN